MLKKQVMGYSKAQIKNWIIEFYNSGLSIKEYSEGKEFHSSTLSYWVKKSQSNSKSFIEVKRSSQSKHYGIEIRRPDGVIIYVTGEISIGEINQLTRC